jgi:hypothetical protein
MAQPAVHCVVLLGGFCMCTATEIYNQWTYWQRQEVMTTLFPILIRRALPLPAARACSVPKACHPDPVAAQCALTA